MSIVPAVTVGALLDARPEAVGLPLELLAGRAGLNRPITSPSIQKTGLALAGFHEFLQPGRVLVYAESELRFLEAMSPDARRASLARSYAMDIPCVLITGGEDVVPEIISEGDRAAVPILRTSAVTAAAMGKLMSLLEDRLAIREIVHGVLLDVLGLGILLIGESGMGKSECALDLVGRGHRLVADDAVEIRRRSETQLVGTCPELTRHHMEVRGLGLINIRDLFGVAATRTSKRIELVVQFDRWDSAREYDRLGLDENVHVILDVGVPVVRMPVAPGRNLAILVEVAARNQILKQRGIHAARALTARLDEELAAHRTVDELGEEDELEPGDHL